MGTTEEEVGMTCMNMLSSNDINVFFRTQNNTSHFVINFDSEDIYDK